MQLWYFVVCLLVDHFRRQWHHLFCPWRLGIVFSSGAREVLQIFVISVGMQVTMIPLSAD